MNPILQYLLLGNLVIGTGAFVVGGMLEPIGRAFGISIAAAGQLLTAYSLANAVLSPLLLSATSALARKRLLLIALALVAAGSALCAMAPWTSALFAGRILAAAGAAIFTPTAAAVAIALVPPAARGKALSTVFLGMSLAQVIGVPLGTWLAFGYGWAWPFWLVALATVPVMVLLAARLPSDIAAAATPLATFGRVMATPYLLAALSLTLLYFAAIFVVFGFVGPVVRHYTGASPGALSFMLFAFGLASIVGTVASGHATDRFGAVRTLVVLLLVMAIMPALLPLARGSMENMTVILCIWGVAGFGLMAPQQARLVQLSPPHAAVLLSLNASMLYLGVALGAALGGLIVGRWGYELLGYAAVLMALMALATVPLSRRLARPITAA